MIADAIKTNPAAAVVHVIGHTDDSGNIEHNKELALARAREVTSYLGGRGISMDQIKVSSYGAERPIAYKRYSSRKTVKQKSRYLYRF